MGLTVDSPQLTFWPSSKSHEMSPGRAITTCTPCTTYAVYWRITSLGQSHAVQSPPG